MTSKTQNWGEILALSMIQGARKPFFSSPSPSYQIQRQSKINNVQTCVPEYFSSEMNGVLRVIAAEKLLSDATPMRQKSGQSTLLEAKLHKNVDATL